MRDRRLPCLADSLGATAFQIGLLGAMYPVFQVIGAPIPGRLSDRYGRKPILVLSIGGTVVGFIVLATAQSLWILFISRALDGPRAHLSAMPRRAKGVRRVSGRHSLRSAGG